MRDDNKDGAACANAHESPLQSLLSKCIQGCIRLVENDEKGIAVEGASERDALALAGRQRSSTFANLGIISLWQADNKIVRVGCFRGTDNRLRREIRVETRYILGDSPSEEFDILGKIPNVPA